MAGVSILAFTTSATDIILSVVAVDIPDGISYSIGCLYGSCLFCSTIAIALTIKNSCYKNILIVKKSIIRDIGLLIITTLFTLFFAY